MFELIAYALFQIFSITGTVDATHPAHNMGVRTNGGSSGWGNDITAKTNGGSSGWGNDITAKTNGGSSGWGNDITAK